MPEDYHKDSSASETVNTGTEVNEPLPLKNVAGVFESFQTEAVNSNQLQNNSNLTEEILSQPDNETRDDANSLENMLKRYLGESREDCPWTIKTSLISGRGVFATRDLKPGDLVFRDIPLVLGPRSGSSCPPVCVGCHKRNSSTLKGCSQGCGLPVCSTVCESQPRHRSECQLLQRQGRTEWSTKLLRAVTPIRCLFLSPEEKKLLLCLQAHHHPQHAFEVEYLKNEVELCPADERFLIEACCVLDANAFETVNAHGSSLRGLFPLAAIMNHQCTPNTYYGYDENSRMVMRAAVHIPCGTEITDSYMPLLWATLARRSRLEATKHFLCCCPRCSDPQETGTRLGALKCAQEGCKGVLLSLDPLRISSRWRCEECGIQMPARQAIMVQKTLSGLLRVLETKDPEQIRSLLINNSEILSDFNQVAIELKSSLIWLYGHCKGYTWNELTEDTLAYKEKLCRQLLELLKTLGAGQCRLRGLHLYELHCTLMEKARRDGTGVDQEAAGMILEATRIFEDDITAPKDVWLRLEELKETS